MEDVLLTDSYDGADAVLGTQDILTTDGLENAVYLSLFGGSSWFGNDILPYDARYSSKTWQVLRSVALTSSGRVAIESAVKEDLQLLARNTGITPGVQVLVATDRADITITMSGLKIQYTYSNGQLT